MSKATNKNLGPFYDIWKLGVSEGAKNSVKDLPEWKFDGKKFEGQQEITRDDIAACLWIRVDP